jgi:hypothetical protein
MLSVNGYQNVMNRDKDECVVSCQLSTIDRLGGWGLAEGFFLFSLHIVKCVLLSS